MILYFGDGSHQDFILGGGNHQFASNLSCYSENNFPSFGDQALCVLCFGQWDVRSGMPRPCSTVKTHSRSQRLCRPPWEQQSAAPHQICIVPLQTKRQTFAWMHLNLDTVGSCSLARSLLTDTGITDKVQSHPACTNISLRQLCLYLDWSTWHFLYWEFLLLINCNAV